MPDDARHRLFVKIYPFDLQWRVGRELLHWLQLGADQPHQRRIAHAGVFLNSMTFIEGNGKIAESDNSRTIVQTHQVKVSREGRVLIPAEVRAALGIGEGSSLSLAVEDGEIRLFDRVRALERARAIARRYKKPGENMVEELLRERRDEAGRE